MKLRRHVRLVDTGSVIYNAAKHSVLLPIFDRSMVLVCDLMSVAASSDSRNQLLNKSGC